MSHYLVISPNIVCGVDIWHINSHFDKERQEKTHCLLSQDSSLSNLHSDLCLYLHPKAASRLSVHCRSGLGPPTSGTQLVLSRRVSVPQRWFTPQEKALDERILLNPVTSYSDKNYADNVAKTTDDAPAARSSCVPVLQ